MMNCDGWVWLHVSIPLPVLCIYTVSQLFAKLRWLSQGSEYDKRRSPYLTLRESQFQLLQLFPVSLLHFSLQLSYIFNELLAPLFVVFGNGILHPLNLG